MSETRALRFWTEYKPGPGGTLKSIDMVELCAVGQADRAVVKMPMSTFLHKLRPVADPVNDVAAIQMHMIKDAIMPAFEAWKRGQEIPSNGTPLGAWPGLTQQQADVIRNFGIRTVEELAQANDATRNRIPLPGMALLCENAKRYLEAADKHKVVAELEEKDKQIASLKADQEEMMKLLESMQEQINADKPRRGRPPKSDIPVELPEAV